MGLFHPLLGTLRAILINRRLAIHINDYATAELPCSIGLPQGRVLSPWLFTLYGSGRLSNVQGLGPQFADDTTVVVRAGSDCNLQSACQITCNGI